MDLTRMIAPKSDQIEHWLPVVGYEGAYEVSDLGRVRSLDRITSHGHKRRGLIRKPTAMPAGYLLVNLWHGNSPRIWLVHRLVLAAFVGPAPEDAEGRHGVGGTGNNELANLTWGTHSENQFDQVAHGTHANASKDACPAGHEYTAANTYVYPGRAHRGCRECRRAHMRAWKDANPDRARELGREANRRYRERKAA